MSVNWPVKRLGDLCTRITVGHVGPMANEYVDNGVPFLRSQDIQPFHIADGGSKFITPEFHAKLKKSELRAGDVAIVRTGFPGTAAVVPQRLDRSNCADLVIATPGPDLNPWFLACLLNSAWGKGAVSGVLVGVAQQHFNVGAAKEMRFSCPPIDIQDRIADILSAYNNQIENNTRRIAILEDMARRLFDEWFVRPIRKLPIPGDRLSEWSLPNGWTFKVLGEVSSVTMGQSPPSSEYNIEGVGLPFHQGVTEFAGHFHGTRLFCKESDRFRKAKEGDILFSVRAPVGRIALALHDLVIGRGLSAIRATTIGQTYLLVHLRSQFSTTDMFGGGTIYKSITKDDLFGVPVLMPDEKTLYRFDVIARDCWSNIRSLHMSNIILRATRDFLLPKLISGEIEVRGAEGALEAAAA